MFFTDKAICYKATTPSLLKKTDSILMKLAHKLPRVCSINMVIDSTFTLNKKCRFFSVYLYIEAAKSRLFSEHVLFLQT